MKLIAITGPSCAGKTTLAREILKDDHFCEVVSFTSRSPRAGEVHDKDYYFLSRKECNDLIYAGEVAEHILFKDNIYGIKKTEIEAKISTGKIPLVIVEPHGLAQLDEIYNSELYSIYLDAPLELLYERFLDRFSKDLVEGGIVNTKYHTSRIKGIYEEKKTWANMCRWDYYIDIFTPENQQSLVPALITKLLTMRE
jgi:guanylate kinase